MGHLPDAPVGVVIGQQLWNASQVGLLLLLLCMWLSHRRWWVGALAFATVMCLPFAIYALSPGAWALTALLLVICATAWTVQTPDLGVTIMDAPARSAPLFTRFEFLAFLCMLLSSMYNYMVSGAIWPHWQSIFKSIATFIGFTPDVPATTQAMYSLGLQGVAIPSYINAGHAVTTGNLGSVIFVVIWAVLPFFYVLYFAALAKLANNSPWTKLQQLLCLCCIIHFLFLTDFVDYKFGRGPVSGHFAEVFHWTERFAWRIAILLPIYQKFTAGDWRHRNGIIGVVFHYVVATWAVFFFVYYVLMVDLPHFYHFVFDGLIDPHQLLGIPYHEALGYYGALVIMVFLYGFMSIAMRGKRISTVVMND
jgi:hypothetical protein